MQYNPYLYGNFQTMNASGTRNLIVLALILFNGIALPQSGYYPPPSSIMYIADTLVIYPPDSLPGDSVVLLGYNIYVDDEFYSNTQVSDPEVLVKFFLDDESLFPGERLLCVDAVYNEWISEESACDTASIIYGYELPFYEDWSSGSFEMLQWTTDSDHWMINTGEGNPAPALSFQGEPGLTDYEAVLESYPINAVGIYNGIIWLDFDIKLNTEIYTGLEILKVEVLNTTGGVWHTVAEYSNYNDLLQWSSEHINIKAFAKNQIFRVRFLAMGANSSDIQRWSIDNIHIYRNCDAPIDLEIEENLEFNLLTWIAPFDGCYYSWLYWDDGNNSGTSIGTGTAAVFDVASRWTPGQLDNYNGAIIDMIAFFPAESQATYRIRIWKGPGPDTMVYDKLVIEPLIGQWNYVWIDDSISIDATQDLWVGYQINAQTGYPAGVDDGPAIDGFGNMINFDGWQTLLELDPGLDYNWNIAVRVDGEASVYDTNMYYNIYRKKVRGNFELHDIAFRTYYKDYNIDLSDIYCYKVSIVHAVYGDTCESDPTNISCEEIMLGTNQPAEINPIKLYPNPASTVLNIESSEKINEIKVFSIFGECVLKLEIGNSVASVIVSELNNGIYFVEVRMEARYYKSKLLIAR